MRDLKVSRTWYNAALMHSLHHCYGTLYELCHLYSFFVSLFTLFTDNQIWQQQVKCQTAVSWPKKGYCESCYCIFACKFLSKNFIWNALILNSLTLFLQCTASKAVSEIILWLKVSAFCNVVPIYIKWNAKQHES